MDNFDASSRSSRACSDTRHVYATDKISIPALPVFTLYISTNRTNSETSWSIQMVPCRVNSLALKVANFNYYLNSRVQLLCYKEVVAADSEVDEVNNFYGNFLWDVFPKTGLFMSAIWYPTIETPASHEASDVVFRRVVSPLAELTHVVLYNARKRNLDSHATVWDEILDLAIPLAIKVRCEEDHDPEQSLYLTVHVGTYSRFYELPGGADGVRDWAPARGHTYELSEDEKDVWELWIQMRDLAVQQREQYALGSIKE